MAVVVLVLWLFTAGAGVYLLVTSNLGRARPAAAPPAAASPRDTKRAARSRFDPPSLVAARNAPVVPGARALLEFAHPACGIIGLGFWLGFTFVHYRALGWIAFGLIAVTACLGLSWLAANSRAASSRVAAKRQDEPGPSFSGRLIALHGGAAAVTVALAALTALVLHS